MGFVVLGDDCDVELGREMFVIWSVPWNSCASVRSEDGISHHPNRTVMHLSLIRWPELLFNSIPRGVFWTSDEVEAFAGDGHLRAVPEVQHRHQPHRDAGPPRLQRDRQPRACHPSTCAVWQGLALRILEIITPFCQLLLSWSLILLPLCL